MAAPLHSASPFAAKTPCDSLWFGADFVTLRDGRYNIIENGALAVKDGKILWIGPLSECPDFSAPSAPTLAAAS